MERTWIREISLEEGMMILRGIGGLKLCVCECALVCLFAVRGGGGFKKSVRSRGRA